jgi:hypothetical protein
MSNTFVPFNFNPVGTSVYTNGETYTVPANKFALVQIFSNATALQGTVSLNGDVFFKSTYIWKDTKYRDTAGSLSTTIPADVLADFQFRDFTDGATTTPQALDKLDGRFTYSNQTITWDVNSANPISFIGAGYGSVNHGSTPAVWAKAGDDIEISANGSINVYVMEYDVPS